MKERSRLLGRGLLAVAGMATYGYLVNAEVSPRPLAPNAPITDRYDYARRQIDRASDDLNPDRAHVTIFGYRLSIGQLNPQDALAATRQAEEALPQRDMAAIDLSILQDTFTEDLAPQPIVIQPSYASYPTHPWDNERMWLNMARQDLAMDRATKGGI